MKNRFCLLAFASAAASTLLAGRLFISSTDLLEDATVTAIAVLALLLSVAAVDRAMFASNQTTVPSGLGFAFGLPFSFFVLQAQHGLETDNYALAQGAERILLAAFVLGLIMFGVRWFLSRRTRQSK